MVAGDEVVGEGGTSGGGRTPRSSRSRPRGTGRAGQRSTSRSSLAPTTGARLPCVDAIVGAGVARVVVGAPDPNPKTDGQGFARLRQAGMDVELLNGEPGRRARRQNEAWRTWIAAGRPFVTYKAAVTLDGRVVVPESRWMTGQESRRRVHELRAASDAVAVGMGTVRADTPRLDARDVEPDRQPRRLAFGTGPLPEGSELELVSGPLDETLKRLAAEGVQSLLLEGGPTLASSFLREGSSTSCSSSSLRRSPGRACAGWARWAPRSPSPGSMPSGSENDLLLTGYIREP